jgi:hypothetical protein
MKKECIHARHRPVPHIIYEQRLHVRYRYYVRKKREKLCSVCVYVAVRYPVIFFRLRSPFSAFLHAKNVAESVRLGVPPLL